MADTISSHFKCLKFLFLQSENKQINAITFDVGLSSWYSDAVVGFNYLGGSRMKNDCNLFNDIVRCIRRIRLTSPFKLISEMVKWYWLPCIECLSENADNVRTDVINGKCMHARDSSLVQS